MRSTLSYQLSEIEQRLLALGYPWIMKVMRQFDPEFGHHVAIASLMLGLCGGRKPWQDDLRLQTKTMGLNFSNPIGIAAGFDKNGMAIRPLARIGFGCVEVGTVTLRPQSGNPKPRLFRLQEDGAVINRMGFNNDGIHCMMARLARIRDLKKGSFKTQAGVPVGVNIGINKIGADPEKDYPELIGMVRYYADYIVLNLSSPNTPGLRDLQHPARLSQILAAIQEKQPNHPPLFIKLAPDLSVSEAEAIVDTILQNKITGLILTNTTISRPDNLQGAFRYESGGLSGRPVRQKSTEMLGRIAKQTQGKLVLIGCGGIETGADVIEKIMHGADLTQLYTAFAYDGPPLISRIKKEILTILERDGVKSIMDLKGAAL